MASFRAPLRVSPTADFVSALRIYERCYPIVQSIRGGNSRLVDELTVYRDVYVTA
ncbi:hypothetical protein BGW80DRAFT_142177 [Lactifluus volemus]|nr:hypothetical protein BGW80DRAFT_142177 [Lactifluus volemus]